MMVRNDEAHAVRTDDTHAATCREIGKLRLPLLSLRACLSEAGGNDDATAYANLRSLADGIEQPFRRYRQDRHIRRSGYRPDVRISFASGDFSAAVVAVALATHYAAGVVFGIAAAVIGAGFHYDTRPAVMAAMGAAFGAALYVFSFHFATLAFPWLVELRGWPTVVAHLIFGITGALMYWQLARRPAKSQRSR